MKKSELKHLIKEQIRLFLIEDLSSQDFDKLADFDWGSLFNDIEDIYKNKETPEETLALQREEDYQNSRYSKKWAATFEEAVKKTVLEYTNAKNEKDKWNAKVYKSAKGKSVEVGDGMYDGGQYSIDYINNRRKENAIKSAEYSMKEALSDLKGLGLTQQEINNLIS